jgi:hypothetical protein
MARFTIAFLLICWPIAVAAQVRRTDHRVPGDPGISLFVRHVAPAQARGAAVLLVHGARVPGLASFDLPVTGGSLAADLALAGHDVYVMDARGYGASTRMPEMQRPVTAGPALGRSSEIVRDIAAIVEWIRGRQRGTAPVILGWGTLGRSVRKPLLGSGFGHHPAQHAVRRDARASIARARLGPRGSESPGRLQRRRVRPISPEHRAIAAGTMGPLDPDREQE